MAKFVYIYSGGGMAETPEAQEATMQAWGTWFGTLGDAVTDMGNPFGASTTLGDGTATATGYSILTADSLDAATILAKDCPILAAGGAVHVHEALEM
jgi:hypothetical protein